MFYLGLALVGLISAGVTYWKSDRKADMLILFAFAAAVITLADWTAYGIFELYDYYPGLLNEHIADSALGEFLAELIFVPSLVVTLIPRLSGLTGIIVGTATVCSLEVVMGALGIYQGSGWVLGMTVMGFAVYFAALDLFWHDLVGHTLPRAHLRAILRGALLLDMIALLALFLRAQQWAVTHIYLLPTRAENNALGRLIAYGVVATSAGYWALSGSGSGRWLRISAATVVLFVFNVIVGAIGLHLMVPPWSITLDTLAQGLAFAGAALAEDAIVALRRRQTERLR